MTNPCTECLVAPMCSAPCQPKIWQRDHLQSSRHQHWLAMNNAPNNSIKRSYNTQLLAIDVRLKAVKAEITTINFRNHTMGTESGSVSSLSRSSTTGSGGGSTMVSSPSRSR